ncbi:hypothetical protein SEVIR_8G171101v4 [Setaria viridis]
MSWCLAARGAGAAKARGTVSPFANSKGSVGVGDGAVVGALPAVHRPVRPAQRARRRRLRPSGRGLSGSRWCGTYCGAATRSATTPLLRLLLLGRRLNGGEPVDMWCSQLAVQSSGHRALAQ